MNDEAAAEHFARRPVPEENLPDGMPPIQHPETTLRHLIRGIQGSGLIPRVIAMCNGKAPNKQEVEKIGMIFREIVLPAFRLVLDAKKQRAKGKNNDADPAPEESAEAIRDEVDRMRKMNKKLIDAGRKRREGGLKREKKKAAE